MRPLACLLAFLILPSLVARAEVLFVADEFLAMEVVAKRLQAEENIRSRIVAQADLPKDLRPFTAVVVYIHKELSPVAEHAFIGYANQGGRLVLLHHSISSGKRSNRDWFPFLGIRLPEGRLEQGGYKWIEGVTVHETDLTPNWIMTNRVTYPQTEVYSITPGEHAATATLPSFTLTGTEVYLNHVLQGPHTLLMGLRYDDAKTGKTWRQPTSGWFRPTGKGWVIYFMPGHTAQDFENAVYGRIVLNAIVAPPAVLRISN
jgi:hypothetical protein